MKSANVLLSLLLCVAVIVVTALLLGGGDKAAIDRAEAQRIEAETERADADWEARRHTNYLVERVLKVGGAILAVIAMAIALVLVSAYSLSKVKYAPLAHEIKARTVRRDDMSMLPGFVGHDRMFADLQNNVVYSLAAPRAMTEQEVAAKGVATVVAIAANAASNGKMDQLGNSTVDMLPGVVSATPIVLMPSQGTVETRRFV